jgi:hypothetical protein
VLLLKLVSPAYLAVSVLLPAADSVMEQPPAATVPVQVAELALSETVTFPLGVPPAEELTAKLTVTAWPTTEASGESPVMVVVVLALLTV